MEKLPPPAGDGGKADEDTVAPPRAARARLRVVYPPPPPEPPREFIGLDEEGTPIELARVPTPIRRRVKIARNVPGVGSPAEVDPPTRTRLKTLQLCGSLRRDSYKPADAVYQSILVEELAAGSRFITADKDPWIFDGATRRMVPVSLKAPSWCAILSRRYGVMAGERLAGNVTGMVQSYCHDLGEKKQVRRYSYFDRDQHCLYLSRYNGECYKLDGDTISIVPNGDAVFFIDDEGGVTVDAEIFDHEPEVDHLFANLVNDVNLPETTETGQTADQQRLLMKVWLMCMGIPDLLVAKPLLLITGVKGAGKTSLAQRLQILAQGRDFAQQLGKNDQDEFGVTLLREALAIIDNVDTVIDWLKDALCAYATGGGWRRRKKYSDDAVHSIRPQAFVALPTMNPATFRRDDVADRVVMINVAGRRKETGYAVDVLTPIKEQRPRLYGEWLWWLNQVVRELASPKTKAEVLQPVHHRLAGFAHLSHVVGRVLKVTPLEVDAMLDAAQAERVSMAAAGDVLVDLIDRWLQSGENEGRSITSQDLFTELSSIAELRSLKFYSSFKTLHERLLAASSADDGPLTRYYHVLKRTLILHGHGRTFFEIRRS